MMPTACRVCGSPALRVVHEAASDYVTGDVFQVWQCSDCAVGFTFPQPQHLTRHYSSEYRRYGRLVSGVLKAFYSVRTARWERRFERPGSVLELGCGDGAMLDSFGRKGWKVVGIERSPEVAAVAHRKFGIPVFVGGLDAVRPAASFDIVILFQVLEHLPDPLATLKQCARLLKPSGQLIIGVPNFDSWQAKYAGPAWFHLDVPRHLFHFSPKSLRKALGLAGLTVTHIGYASIEHDPYGWVESFLNKALGQSNALTRRLMHMDGAGAAGPLLFGLAGAVAIPSVAMSLASWILRAGALMQVTCERVRGDA